MLSKSIEDPSIELGLLVSSNGSLIGPHNLQPIVLPLMDCHTRDNICKNILGHNKKYSENMYWSCSRYKSYSV